MLKELITAILTLFYWSLSDLAKKAKKKSNRIVWEGKPERWPYALSCKMSIIMGLMACIVPVLLLLMTWDPWDQLTPIPTTGSETTSVMFYGMFIALLFWGLKVSIGRVIYRYWTAPDVHYKITESEVIKKVKDGITRISRDDIRKVIISQSKIFRGIGTVSFVTDDIDDDLKQTVPIGTDYPVEGNEDDTKTYALTFYGVKEPEKIKNLIVSEDESIYIETFKPIDNRDQVRPMKIPALIGAVLLGFGILIAPIVPVWGVPLALIGTLITMWYATVGREE